MLKVDLRREGLEIRVVEAVGLETTSEICRRVGAFAALSGTAVNEVEKTIAPSTTRGKIFGKALSDTTPRAAFGVRGNKFWADRLTLENQVLIPRNPTDYFDWAEADFILCAGPLLAYESRLDLQGGLEGISEPLRLADGAPHRAWSALGFQKNLLFLMTVDSDQPGLSKGMTPEHVAGFLLSRCYAPYALAIESGETVTLVADGRVLNFPSGKDAQGRWGEEKPVANALCLFISEDQP